jgi:DNA-binding GntR family transcriptional regulator
MNGHPAPGKDGNLAPTKSGRLHERVYDAIKNAIYSGHFAPGEALRELQLAAELQVSQATIREALLRLERTGLVVRTHNKGTRVVRLSRKQQRDRVELRALLEGMAAVKAANNMNSAAFAELRQLELEIERAQHANALFDASQADLHYHRFIWGHSNNEALCQILEMLSAPMIAYVSLERARDVSQWAGMPHESITAALRKKEPDAIRRALESHIEKSFEQFLHPSHGEEGSEE